MNKKELRAEMARHGDSSKELAQYLGISSTSLSLKMNAKRDFRLNEIQKIALRYSLSAQDTERIFFAIEVA